MGLALVGSNNRRYASPMHVVSHESQAVKPTGSSGCRKPQQRDRREAASKAASQPVAPYPGMGQWPDLATFGGGRATACSTKEVSPPDEWRNPTYPCNIADVEENYVGSDNNTDMQLFIRGTTVALSIDTLREDGVMSDESGSDIIVSMPAKFLLEMQTRSKEQQGATNSSLGRCNSSDNSLAENANYSLINPVETERVMSIDAFGGDVLVQTSETTLWENSISRPTWCGTLGRRVTRGPRLTRALINQVSGSTVKPYTIHQWLDELQPLTGGCTLPVSARGNAKHSVEGVLHREKTVH
uniref:Uncharacterized protein n=1 Tax=Trypanosoma congolense (strain IL3000) TaxID=1068625 RepID=G0UWA3_TRYCI|nr:conserved hypothetical protein [Trypanosoma congolense IL3000]